MTPLEELRAAYVVARRHPYRLNKDKKLLNAYKICLRVLSNKIYWAVKETKYSASSGGTMTRMNTL